jgi:hypothetical protein
VPVYIRHREGRPHEKASPVRALRHSSIDRNASTHDLTVDGVTSRLLVRAHTAGSVAAWTGFGDRTPPHGRTS